MRFRRRRSWLCSSSMMSDFRGLYIHVPFCVRKCPYCDFYSTAGRGDLLENYAAAVVRNLREYPEQFDTVYFGGGTPNLIAEYMPGILKAVSTIPGAEISAECNPASASPETLRIMRRAGVNRISVGVQSLQDNELKSWAGSTTQSRRRNLLSRRGRRDSTAFPLM